MIENNDIHYLFGVIGLLLSSLSIQLQIEIIVVAIVFDANQHLCEGLRIFILYLQQVSVQNGVNLHTFDDRAPESLFDMLFLFRKCKQFEIAKMPLTTNLCS